MQKKWQENTHETTKRLEEGQNVRKMKKEIEEKEKEKIRSDSQNMTILGEMFRKMKKGARNK